MILGWWCSRSRMGGHGAFGAFGVGFEVEGGAWESMVDGC